VREELERIDIKKNRWIGMLSKRPIARVTAAVSLTPAGLARTFSWVNRASREALTVSTVSLPHRPIGAQRFGFWIITSPLAMPRTWPSEGCS